MLKTQLSLPISQYSSPTPEVGEFSRLLTAAVISRGFRDLLLNDPATAIMLGYQGEGFCLSQEAKQWACSIRARSLPDYAAQLLEFPRHTAGRTAIPVKLPVEVAVKAAVEIQ